ncbi:MAG: 3-ketoacyl-ACP reductase [Caldilineaceae bacterium]|nr:3-ketoacyl-ACP reductase [Caldilineaceae bacterium]
MSEPLGSPVALVTGASRGIGRGIATALAAQGWTVVINYRGNVDAAQEAAEAVTAAGGRSLVVQADIGDAADREKLVRVTLDTFGRLDLLVNNAGMAPRQRMDLLATTEASYDEVMGVNLKGPFFLTQHVANAMIELIRQGLIDQPKIINIGSMSAYTASVNRGEYCISKAGLGMMTALFADRLAEYGILVYEVRPGVIATDMTSVVKARYDALIDGGLTPVKRWGEPDDVARAVLAIAQGYLPFSTGEVINVDGGFHLRRL